VIASGIRRRRV